MPESRPAFLREVINALLTPDSAAADLSLKSDSDVSSARLRNQTHPPAKPRNTRKNPQSQAGRGFAGLWEDYKIDFFAFLGLVFVPLRKILNFQSWVWR